MTVEKEPQGIFGFMVETPERQDDVTARAGLALVAEAVRAVGLDGAAKKHLEVRQRQVGYTDAEKLEALILLQCAGGECVEDIRLLASDAGILRMLGCELPSPDSLHRFLARFHDEDKVKGRPAEGAFIPDESVSLQALARVNRSLVHRAATGRRATLDLDATIIESHKKEALWHYKKGRGYQPVLVMWAEEDLVVADEFRDGNVPAGMKPLPVARRAFQSLPDTVTERAFRGDSACYEEALLKWLSDSDRKEGPPGRIDFSISADMTVELQQACHRVEEWKPLEDRVSETVDWSEVEFTPGDWNKEANPLRYIALRITKKEQADLFEGLKPVRYLAVVSNRVGITGPELVKWHWAKAGTIEHVHDIMKNELGAGTMPSKLFGRIRPSNP